MFILYNFSSSEPKIMLSYKGLWIFCLFTCFKRVILLPCRFGEPVKGFKNRECTQSFLPGVIRRTVSGGRAWNQPFSLSCRWGLLYLWWCRTSDSKGCFVSSSLKRQTPELIVLTNMVKAKFSLHVHIHIWTFIWIFHFITY